MKILVTGAAGFIGFHTARALLERGDKVVGLDNLNEYYDVTLKRARLEILEQQPSFRFTQLDLADRGAMADLFAAEQLSGSSISVRRPVFVTASNTRSPMSTAMCLGR